MAKVIIRLVCNGRVDPYERTINEDTLKSSSLVLREHLNSLDAPDDGSPKRVELDSSNFAPTHMVLEQIQKRGHTRHFKVQYPNDMPPDRLCMLYGVTEYLQIRPRQIDMRKHIRSLLSHTKFTPTQIIKLHRILVDMHDEKLEGEKLGMWEVLIHQVAYAVTKGDEEENGYSQEHAGKLHDNLYQQQPDLADAIDKKIEELKKRQGNYDDARAREARKEAEKAQRAETARINRLVREHKAEKREQQEAELRGERELSEGMAKVVLTRAPDVMHATIVEGKHGKRNPPGQGKRGTKKPADDDEEKQNEEVKEEDNE